MGSKQSQNQTNNQHRQCDGYQQIQQNLHKQELDEQIRLAQLLGRNNNKQVQKNEVYVKEIPKNVDEELLQNFFSKYGQVQSCKICRNKNNQSKGNGYVIFVNKNDKVKAIEQTKNNQILKAEECKQKEKNLFNTLYVRNFPNEYNEEQLKEIFGKYGEISQVKIKNNNIGPYAFIRYGQSEDEQSHLSAIKAINDLHGKEIYGKYQWYVQEFKKKEKKKKPEKNISQKNLENLSEKKNQQNLSEKKNQQNLSEKKNQENLSKKKNNTSKKQLKKNKNISQNNKENSNQKLFQEVTNNIMVDINANNSKNKQTDQNSIHDFVENIVGQDKAEEVVDKLLDYPVDELKKILLCKNELKKAVQATYNSLPN